MVAQQQGQESDQARDSQRRRAAIAAFLAGSFAALAFFAFFPGLPHIIDWGAILASLAVGALAQWGCRSWMKRTTTKKPEHT
ncbi:hypothetical protein [Streptomyces sp. Tu102]|uniref:hypothetical protein n=1 Tax=Streptomyces sp. Tu102 TaxID=2838019 RepID=UPI001BDBD509|nr:hypothetical protein [Streptomyces sp. Tu102]MBT1092331.1 hypothetical protein [Streptomyces sp. Tu102]